MAVLYIHLDCEGFKSLEKQARAFEETTHKSTGGFYHKSLRLKLGGGLTIEFHGPLVGGYGHNDEVTAALEALVDPAPGETVCNAPPEDLDDIPF
jgi:hypothetical protein